MKKQKIFNFALTTMCVAVLSACGSSGGGSLAVENTPTTPSANANANTGADNSAALAAAQKAAEEAAAKQAAAEETAKKAQAEADKAKADAANTVQDAQNKLNDAVANLSKALEDAKQQGKDELLAEQEEAKRKAEEAEKNAAAEKANPFNQKYLLQNTPAKEGESFVGLKHVVKNNSNLATNSSLVKDSTSDIPTMMTVQGPQRSLDTIVVAERLATQAGDKASRTYLEDFDTRATDYRSWQALNGFNQTRTGVDAHAAKGGDEYMENRSIGNTALLHVYINSVTTGKDAEGSNPAIEAERAVLKKAYKAAQNVVDDLNQKAADAEKIKDDFQKNLDGFISEVEIAGFQVPRDGANKTAYTTNGYASETQRLMGIIQSNNASITQKQIAQQELDVLVSKNEKLIKAAVSATAPIEEKRVIVNNALNALNKFNAENPEPTNLQDVSVKRKDVHATATAVGADANAVATHAGLTAGVIKNPANNGSTALYETKTDTMGQKVGAIWTFSRFDSSNRHQNFTEHGENVKKENQVSKGFVVHSQRNLDGNLIVNQYDVKSLEKAGSDPAVNDRVVDFRTQDNTIAEIYGYRSKAMGNFEKPLDSVDNAVEPNTNSTANNLPLVNDYEGARLQHVQYGRVTSALSDRTSTSDFYKDGIKMNDATKTYVASFGEYGEEGTENHFFFRGVNNVGGTELTKLKESTKNGVITYEGHAVTYGLNNNFMGNRDIPTALGNGSGFVSGNHAKAEVNLATNAVTGSIFNKWYDPASPKALRDIDLVQFKGTIADNGNIAGDALRVDNQTTGLFGAALYGAGAEMGGTVASHDKAAGKHWGGVFGAIRKGVEEAPKQSPQDANSVDQRPQLP